MDWPGLVECNDIGYVLRRDNDVTKSFCGVLVLRRALSFEVVGKKGVGNQI